MNVHSLYFSSPAVFGQIATKYIFNSEPDNSLVLTTFFGNERLENRVDRRLIAPIELMKSWRIIDSRAELFSDDELDE